MPFTGREADAPDLRRLHGGYLGFYENRGPFWGVPMSYKGSSMLGFRGVFWGVYEERGSLFGGVPIRRIYSNFGKGGGGILRVPYFGKIPNLGVDFRQGSYT